MVNVNLPQDVVHYFVRCTVEGFFQMRILNRVVSRVRKMKPKLRKHVR